MKNKEFILTLAAGAVITVVLSALCLRFSSYAGMLCLVLGIVLLVLFCVSTSRRYREIRRLNDYLTLVCSGNYSLNIEDNAEGELSVLKNNLYKVITKLQTQNDVIVKDKTYLADSLADISHQLKTPLTSMMVVSELLEKETDEARRKEFTDIITNRCEKMSRLVQTLLKISKLDAGTAELASDELSVCDVLEDSLQPFLLTLDIKNITVEKQLTDFTFIGDRMWSAEALQNIIKNCIEHTPQGGQLTLETQETTLYKAIYIRDNGCGIAAEDLPHIFERFYHGKNASSDSVGIGLALSKSILNAEGAGVSVRSEENVGTEFEIRFYKSVV